MGYARSLIRSVVQGATSICLSHWKPYSRLITVGGGSGKWVIGHEMQEVSNLAAKMNISLGPTWAAAHGRRQAVFLGNHFDLLLSDRWFQTDHRLATAYFHGKPGQGVQEFDKCFETLARKHQFIHRVQVSCKAMHNCILKTGIDPVKVHHIPIGINLGHFKPQTRENRVTNRERFSVPQDAFVVGSFQKDGNGWGEGLEPKWPKGPEIFLKAIAILKQFIPNLFVLLSGPARGFVKEGLKKLNVPYQHCYLKYYPDIAALYHCLDIYIIASREEGGPKSVLECMASCVPLVTTRVGQAEDLVIQGQNGWMVGVGDAEGLALGAVHYCKNHEEIRRVTAAGLTTAHANTYEAQIPLWTKFFQGFVE